MNVPADPSCPPPSAAGGESSGIRLQVYLAHAGVASRRTSGAVILDGRVQVNGRPVTDKGFRVTPADTVCVDGKPVFPEQAKRYVLLNKPAGVVSTNADEQGRRTAVSLLAGAYRERLYNIGRLDMYSEGAVVSDARAGSLSQRGGEWLRDNLEIQGFTVKFSLNVGAKFSRVMNAVLRAVIEQGNIACPDYEKWFAAFSDAAKTKPEKLKFVLSIHPADYMRMSFGNSWESCHKLGRGCYQAGTLSYMLDTCSMVGYVVKHECKDEYWKEGKIFRQMFMYNGAEMLKSRLYPDYSTNDAIYGKVFADCVAKILDIPSDWKKVSTTLTTMAQGKGSVAYPDFTFSYYNTWSLVDPTYLTDEAFIVKTTPIGEPPMCPKCGREHKSRNTCYCNYCS